MSPGALPMVRWVLLAITAFQLLIGTVLYDRVQAPLIRRFEAFAERSGKPVPALLIGEWFLRAWAIFGGVVLLALWWYLGTPGGVAMWGNLTSPRG